MDADVLAPDSISMYESMESVLPLDSAGHLLEDSSVLVGKLSTTRLTRCALRREYSVGRQAARSPRPDSIMLQ